MARVTIRHLAQWKQAGQRFAMLTAYDYSMAKWLAQAGVQVLLVGDSLGNVILGYPDTLPVTMEDMVRHTAAVVRGSQDGLVIADMPFLSYQVAVEEAVRNAGRLVKEAGAQAVKLEGGSEMADAIRAIVRAGIPVMAHLGLTPQSIHQLGGHRTQAADEAGRRRLLKDALAVEAAGAFAVVLEKVPEAAAVQVTRRLSIPTVGCGSPACDGQVLVTHDILGLYPDFTPSFVKPYAELGKATMAAARAFAEDVRKGALPERPAAAQPVRKRRKP